jgi:hypothetical protein
MYLYIYSRVCNLFVGYNGYALLYMHLRDEETNHVAQDCDLIKIR